ncbi:MAG TPA: hypothetical protein VFZ32_03020 [Micromonosporaceae bacterium]
MADSMEATQLDLAGELLEEARRILDGREWTPSELHELAVQLTEALGSVHRIAVSRARLPAPAYEDLDAIDDRDEDDQRNARSLPDVPNLSRRQ